MCEFAQARAVTMAHCLFIFYFTTPDAFRACNHQIHFQAGFRAIKIHLYFGKIRVGKSGCTISANPVGVHQKASAGLACLPTLACTFQFAAIEASHQVQEEPAAYGTLLQVLDC